MNTTDSQSTEILRHLAQGKTLTPLEALDKFQTLRLSGRIFDLRAQGWPIACEMVTTASGKRVASYSLPEACK